MSEATSTPSVPRAPFTAPVLADVHRERRRQDAKWGEQNHNPVEWMAILAEEVGEASQEALGIHFRDPREVGDTDVFLLAVRLRGELVQVAAVAVAFIECLDRGEFRG